MSTPNHLREARDALIPQVPVLAPQLADHPMIITNALHAQLEEQGADPAIISPADLNKAERHVLAGFGANALREVLVEGSGPDSSFRNFSFVKISPFRTDWGFTKSVIAFQKRGAKKVAANYTNGDDPEHQWWPLARNRYHELGDRLHNQAPSSIPIEGRSLDEGMRTRALPKGGIPFLAFVRNGVNDSAEERRQAAHDLIYFPLALAGIHVQKLLYLNKRGLPLSAAIVKDSSGMYRMHHDSDSRQWMSPAELRNMPYPTTTMKCPMHAPPINLSSLPGEASNELHNNTNLRIVLHGLINAAYDSRFFEDHGLFLRLISRRKVKRFFDGSV